MTETAPEPRRTFRAHVEHTALTAAPLVHSGLHESVAEFFAVTAIDLDPQLEIFEPSQGNEWLRPGYAAAVAHGSEVGAPASEYPFTLAIYVEGDVTRYRFPRFEDASRAGRLWAVGLI